MRIVVNRERASNRGGRRVLHFRWLFLLALESAISTVAGNAQTAEVGGLAVRISGNAGPTVVFESGQGESMQTWNKVAAPLSACMRVVVYDRFGVGKSAARSGTGPVVAAEVAGQLARLLKGLELRPPYILVGHSLGGLYVQSFARLHPDIVLAVVLVDAASPLEPPGVFVPTTPQIAGSISAAEEAGVTPSIAAINAGPPFPPIPLIVLAATDHDDRPEREALWLQVQARTAKLSPKGRLEVIKGSGHFIQKDRPQQVIAAVLQAARAAGVTPLGCHDPKGALGGGQ